MSAHPRCNHPPARYHSRLHLASRHNEKQSEVGQCVRTRSCDEQDYLTKLLGRLCASVRYDNALHSIQHTKPLPSLPKALTAAAWAAAVVRQNKSLYAVVARALHCRIACCILHHIRIVDAWWQTPFASISTQVMYSIIPHSATHDEPRRRHRAQRPN